MINLKRLKIGQFRNIKPGTELFFSDGLNIVLGQNGTGKTTLLELISSVLRWDFEAFEDEPFALEFEIFERGKAHIKVKIQNCLKPAANSTLKSEVLGFQDAGRSYRASTTVDIENLENGRKYLIRFDPYEGMFINDEKMPEDRVPPSCLSLVFLLMCSNLVPGGERVILSPIMSLHLARRFDESLEFLAGLIRGDGISHFAVFHLEGREPPSLLGRALPAELTRGIESQYDRLKSDYSIPHPKLPFLAEVNRLFGFASAELKVEIIERKSMFVEVGERIRLGNFVFRFWWQNGEFITHQSLSYGQKRLLSFFYYLACNPDILIADELVNGLHHRWITECVEAIGQRQAFLTSQNPLLLDYIPFDSSEQVLKSFVMCTSIPTEGQKPGFVWANMSEEQASTFFSAYQIGIEHVSEILQSQGLF